MLPPYTDDDYLLPPPYRLADMDVLGFWLSAKSAPLQAYLDRRMNVGGQYRYMLLNQIVGASLGANMSYPMLLTFHDIGRLYSSATLGNESLESRGYFSYKEMILWVPVFGMDAHKPALLDFLDGSIPPLFLVTPLILADNAIAVAGGREIFGLPKRLGEIRMPAIPTPQQLQAAGLRLDQALVGQSASALTDVLPTYASTTLASRQSILDVTFSPRPADEGGTTPAGSWEILLKSVVTEASRFFRSLMVIPFLSDTVEAAIGVVANAFIDAFVESIHVAAHKELRVGVTDYRQPGFRSMNSMKYEINFESGHLINGLDIDITPHPFANLSLASMFGLSAERVGFAFHARLNGELSGSDEHRLNP